MVDYCTLYYRFDSYTGERNMVELIGFVIPEYATTIEEIVVDAVPVPIGDFIYLN